MTTKNAADEIKEQVRADFMSRFAPKKFGTTQRALAFALGRDEDTIHNWSRPGRALPDIAEVRAAADVMKIDPGYLAFGSHYAMSPRERDALELLRRCDEAHGDAALDLLRKFARPEGAGEKSASPRQAGSSAPAANASDSLAALVAIDAAHAANATNTIDYASIRSKDIRARSIQPAQPLPAMPLVDDMRAAANAAAVTTLTAPSSRSSHTVAPAGSSRDLKHEPWPYAGPNFYQMTVQGVSMKPLMREGDRVILEKCNYFMPVYDEDRGHVDTKLWKSLDGEVVLAFPDDDKHDAVLKRLEITYRKDTGFKIHLRSDNPAVKTIEIRRENSLRVVGIVRQVLRNPKQID